MKLPSERLELSQPEVVVLDGRPTTHNAAGGVPARPEGRWPLGRVRRSLAAALLVLALVAVVTAVLLSGDDDVTTQPKSNTRSTAGAQAADPRITIEAPASVIAGQAAGFTVNYEVATGRFSGSIEEWGDGIGGASASQERCETTEQTTGPSSGRYPVTHTWADPGTYDVVLGVNTYSCTGSQSREFKATRTLSVTVVAP